mgnify:CR=1 FL=1
MATRDARVAEFNSPADAQGPGPLRLLCEDHVGSYVIPFPCILRDGVWRNAATGELIEAEVIGWVDFSLR